MKLAQKHKASISMKQNVRLMANYRASHLRSAKHYNNVQYDTEITINI